MECTVVHDVDHSCSVSFSGTIGNHLAPFGTLTGRDHNATYSSRWAELFHKSELARSRARSKGFRPKREVSVRDDWGLVQDIGSLCLVGYSEDVRGRLSPTPLEDNISRESPLCNPYSICSWL